MKKYTIHLLIWIACLGNLGHAQPVSEQRAKAIATSFFYEQMAESPIVSSPFSINSANISVNINVQAQVWQQLERTCMYAVSMPDSGWVLVSGDERIEPILAMSDNGTFPNREDMPPAMLGLLEDYMDEITFILDSCPNLVKHPNWTAIEQGSYLQTEQLQVHSPGIIIGGYVAGTTLLNRPSRGEVRWNQLGHQDYGWDFIQNTAVYNCDYAYNKFCPTWYTPSCGHTYVGCVAVAIAQIMWYWQWPHTGAIHSGIDKKGNGTGAVELHLYDWTKMPPFLTVGSPKDPTTPMEQVNMVAGFLRDCGYAAKMEYGDDGSGSTIQKARTALEDVFAYNVDDIKRKFWTANWGSKLKAEINAGRPVYYQGSSTDSGHAFVVDGYNSVNKFHINWGWGGSYNDWFTLDSLAPTSKQYYKSQQAALFGVYPAPACGSKNINGGTTYRAGVAGAVTVANLTVPAGTTAVYYSGTSVRLLPGFKASAGSHTHIAIQNFPCNGVAPLSLGTLEAQNSMNTEDIDMPSYTLQEEPETQAPLAVYPNPTNGSLHVSSQQAITRIMLYNLYGEKVHATTGSDLNLSALPAGMYLLLACFENNTTAQTKVIKTD